MRLYNILLFLLAVILIVSCKSSDITKKDSTSRERFAIIINDYYKKNKSDIKKYDVFSVDESFPTAKNYYLYSVLPQVEDNFYIMRQKDAYLPSDYINYRGKIFLLHEQETDNLREHSYDEVLKCLDSLNMLDSTHVKLELGLLKRENAVFRRVLYGSKKAVYYTICKDKSFKIKKRIKSKVHIYPDDKRFENVCD